ncbi:MAG: hypothetical protein MI865_02605 [Proteobacteria bacterium]|nr:hypothetical protein [Pseudomonadota bacterium]
MKFCKILTLGLLLLPLTSLAVDSDGNYAVWGVGKKACFGFLKANEAGDIEKYQHYIKGFLTAYNIFTEKTYNISGKMDENQVLEWIIEYCEENQMSSVENALTSFTFDHYESRTKSAKRGFRR